MLKLGGQPSQMNDLLKGIPLNLIMTILVVYAAQHKQPSARADDHGNQYGSQFLINFELSLEEDRAECRNQQQHGADGDSETSNLEHELMHLTYPLTRYTSKTHLVNKVRCTHSSLPPIVEVLDL